ncbi:WhiB family transcriptional regulator [Streptomyces longwoodensis]|uniref:WhiB family transcriptional regulator n=1 Tax=Streptomyces longwoodensis TaxID=68231 RepID=UPI0037AA56B6
MTRITHQVHGTPDHGDHWRTQAACADPQYHGHEDLWFASHADKEAVAAAKRICGACPVRVPCLREALTEEGGQSLDRRFGIRGGTTATERLNAYRRARKAATPIQPPVSGIRPPASLAEAFARRTARTSDGHLTWTGTVEHIKFGGQRYTALQAAFIVSHGREPDGPVRRSCGADCYRGDHLTDATIRDSQAVCGTPEGYRRHRRHGEDACPACRRANTDADNRPRRTGTTKAAA